MREKSQLQAIELSLLVFFFGWLLPVSAQIAPPSNPMWWQAPAIAHAKQMYRLFPGPLGGSQQTRLVIPTFESDPDPTGFVATDQPAGETYTESNAFFQ